MAELMLALEKDAVNRQRNVADVIASGASSVEKFYSGTNVFVTGGSGFLGKQLLEKLFRCCNVNKVYLLMRAKKGKTAQQRVKQILEDPVFDSLHNQKPKFADNVLAVSGDVSELKLGLSASDWDLITEQASHRQHLFLDFIGSIVHVSTAYCHATKSRVGQAVKEQFYDSPVPPNAFIDMAENIDENKLENMMQMVKADWPNSYSFSKALGEEIVRSEAGNLPISIVRPAIVISSYREPLPGWIDPMNSLGPSGLILGLMTGIIHVLRTRQDIVLSLVPADLVTNTTLVAAWETTKAQSNEGNIKIYNITNNRNPLLWAALDFFINNDWKFQDDNTLSLQKNMSSIDRDIFNCDIANLDRKEYIKVWVYDMESLLALERQAQDHQHDVAKIIASGASDVERFYAGSNIFLTGGTGFIGKHIIEKLFRCCNVNKVYLLLRSKKGKTVQQRIDQILKDPVFESLQKYKPDFVTNIIPIEGDISEKELGIGADDRNIITEQVNIIFHVAAIVNFDEIVKVATLANVRGTREIVRLAKCCKQLRQVSVVHVSTAYSHATKSRVREEVKEQFYDSPIPPNAIIEMAETIEQNKLENMMQQLKKDFANTYTFTKAVAEEVIRTEARGLPICVVRPSVGISAGVIHSARSISDIVVSMVPVDIVINTILVAAWNNSKRPNHENTKIYNITGNRNPLQWGYACNVLDCARYLISSRAIWYCHLIQTPYKLPSVVLFWLLHFIPAFFVDFALILTGKRPLTRRTEREYYSFLYVASPVNTTSLSHLFSIRKGEENGKRKRTRFCLQHTHSSDETSIRSNPFEHLQCPTDSITVRVCPNNF
ncbi:Putative fatty acyl-CoA reductase CG5065 [Papilio machaon]|uniref:Fatty acyl-CoA reductase n=1 Tax=Papilio machaon TaxID=76193 RepID=A0A194QZH1_PAPMA|nr:Putative fatty acyl-CoA reductase CG5065 [Papilio machaon]